MKEEMNGRRLYALTRRGAGQDERCCFLAQMHVCKKGDLPADVARHAAEMKRVVIGIVPMREPFGIT